MFLERRGDGQQRGSGAVGPALPGNDRPRREDADRLRMDPDSGEIGHLGPDPRADGFGQGTRGADDSRVEPPGDKRSSRRSTARHCPTRCSSPSSSATKKEHLPGAYDRKPGRLEMANHGTLLLDEIGDLSLAGAGQTATRARGVAVSSVLAAQKAVHVDFRLISATNRPLDLFVRDGRFREDLFYRVNAFAIRLPSLRERPVDIPVLASRFPGSVLCLQRAPTRRQDVLGGSDRAVPGLSVARKHP